jgi:hypothetical protein
MFYPAALGKGAKSNWKISYGLSSFFRKHIQICTRLFNQATNRLFELPKTKTKVGDLIRSYMIEMLLGVVLSHLFTRSQIDDSPA